MLKINEGFEMGIPNLSEDNSSEIIEYERKYASTQYSMNVEKKSINFMDFSNFENAWKCAEMISKARCIPTEFQGNPADILVAIQFGHDLGLKPMASLQNIMIVNNRPSIYGDIVLALCMAHPDFIDCIETYDEETETAFCTMKRKGREPITKKFSRKMAETAGLWGKSGAKGVSAWVTFPDQMLIRKARGFCTKAMWPDVLKGISVFEDMKDVEQINSRELSDKTRNTAQSMKERLLEKSNNTYISEQNNSSIFSENKKQEST